MTVHQWTDRLGVLRHSLFQQQTRLTILSTFPLSGSVFVSLWFKLLSQIPRRLTPHFLLHVHATITIYDFIHILQNVIGADGAFAQLNTSTVQLGQPNTFLFCLFRWFIGVSIDKLGIACAHIWWRFLYELGSCIIISCNLQNHCGPFSLSFVCSACVIERWGTGMDRETHVQMGGLHEEFLMANVIAIENALTLHHHHDPQTLTSFRIACLFVRLFVNTPISEPFRPPFGA